MPTQLRKMSDLLKEMAELAFKDRKSPPTVQAMSVALLYAHIAWNESVGLKPAREFPARSFKELEAANPHFWDEFKSTDLEYYVKAMSLHRHRNMGLTGVITAPTCSQCVSTD